MTNESEIELAYAKERIETLEGEIDSLIEELALERSKRASVSLLLYAEKRTRAEKTKEVY